LILFVGRGSSAITISATRNFGWGCGGVTSNGSPTTAAKQRSKMFATAFSLLGAYRTGKLHYFGHSGTGFSEKGLAEAIDRLRPFFANKPPAEIRQIRIKNDDIVS
jgi:hypothetical protein